MIDDKYKRAVREIGRFSYFEPNNLDMNAPDNAIVNNPEDYCISVSLSVWLADRNSCGDGNAKRSFIYTSQNGTISFMGGSGKGDGNPGYLTTKFTEINSDSDSRGNKECLGIEYINITYDSWFFPTVQIKFVDIKGAALMDPSETASSISMINNPQDITQISSGSFYRALFAYPRPLFKLSVKGFYGKEVTFDLTVKDSKIDFDSKSGNFTMVVNFIGFMYGVYTDIPMTYLMVAPYINPSYWETATATRLKIGNEPIPRFPELMRKLMVLNNEMQDKINANQEGRDFNAKSEKLNKIKLGVNLFTEANGKRHTPWIKVRNKDNGYGYTYVLIQDYDKAFEEAGLIAGDIENTYNDLQECGMEVKFDGDWGDRIERAANGYVFIPKYYVDENGDLWYVKGITRNGYIDNAEEVKDDFQAVLNTLKDKTRFATSSYKTETTNELLQILKECDVRIDGTEITDLRNKYVTFTNTKVDEQLSNYTRSLEKEVRDLEKKVGDIKNGIVEEELGFKLSIENVFKIIFAHMDAFIAAYYDVLGNIKSKIDGKERNVKKIFGDGGSIWHDIPDGMEDVSPFPYYCEDNGDGYVAVYPKDYCPDECAFVESLLQSSDKYNAAYDEAMKYLEQMMEDQRRGNPLSTDTENFIPLSFSDMLLNKGGYNPYDIVMNGDVKNEKKFEQLMLVFLLRLAYLTEVYQTTKTEIFTNFGKVEADNFLKSVKKYGTNKYLVNVFPSKIESFTPQSDIFQKKIFNDNGKYNENAYKNLLPIGEFNELKISEELKNGKYENKKYLAINNGVLSGLVPGSTYFVFDGDTSIKEFVWNIKDNVEKDFFNIPITYGNKTFAAVYGKNIRVNRVNVVVKQRDLQYGTEYEKEFPLTLDEIIKKSSIGEISFKKNNSLTDGIVIDGSNVKSVFNSSWFNENEADDIKKRAYFYIFSVPVTEEFRDSEKYNGAFLKTALLQEGAYYWYNENSGFTIDGYKMPENGEVPIINDKNLHEVCTILKKGSNQSYIKAEKYFNLKNYDENRKKELRMFFEEWADNGVQGFSFLNKNLKENYSENIGNVQDFLVTLYCSLCTTYDITKPIITNGTNNQGNNIKNAYNAFITKLNEAFDYDSKTNVNPTKLTSYSQTNYDHQDDFRLSTYLNLKNLYDKWFASSDRSTWTYNEDPTANPDSEFNNFFYIDTFYNDIGDRATVNGDMLVKLIKESLSTPEMKELKDSPEYKGRSLFEFLSLIAQNCEMTLLALPQAYALKGYGEGKNDHIADVFRPLPFGRMVEGKSGGDKMDYASTVKHSYVCLYSHKPSSHLDDGFMYKNDSYDINVTNEKLLPTPLQKVGKNSIPAFGVSFGKMNQSYFKDIGFDMSDQQVTEETINTTQSIAANGSDGTPVNGVLYGQDLYRVFSNYSYKCNVEMMGDAQIMPLMYFQLNNIPMWRGAYMIIKVEHSIRANSMTTKFTGVRQSKNQMPFVEEGLMYTNHNGDDRVENRGDRFVMGDPMSGSLKGAGSFNERDEIVKSGRILKGRELQDPITVIGTNKDPDVTRERPIIVLTPAHSQKDKPQEHRWSKKLINGYIAPMLLERLGPSFKSHILVDDSSDKSGYICKLAKQKVIEYGSDRVISVVPHWNANYSYYFAALVNGRGVREDALKFSQIFVDEALTLIKQERVDITLVPPTRESSKIMDHMGNDPAVWLNCACVLSENFFANWPSESGSVGWNNEPTAAPGTGREWLESPKGLKTIAELHVNAIEKYIKSLSS